VGKESFPKIIHAYSPRKHQSYIAVNCGAIPEGTIDSELFGHVKGAFTGAIDERKGYFGEANGGTIFLDEVGELPLSTQARLLRVLESGEYIKVGSSKVEKTNVRIVAATNLNMTQAIADGRFRKDLFYRLSVVPIMLPPLRERGTDVLLLFRKFAADFAEKYRMPAIRLTEDGKQSVMTYSWPGNIRELKNVVERISILEENRDVDAEMLRRYLKEQSRGPQLPVLLGAGEKNFENEREFLVQALLGMRQEIQDLKKQLEDLQQKQQLLMQQPVPDQPSMTLIHPSQSMGVNSPKIASYYKPASTVKAMADDDDIQDTEVVEEENLSISDALKEKIIKALEKHHGRRKNAAAELGISERTLYRKIKDYGLDKGNNKNDAAL
jgi:transcriptional regulator with PAS, ATPase and Fis domain